MFSPDKEFEKLSHQVKMEEEKYLNAQVTIENYKFPHIYLTEEEIEEFNKDCEKYGYDIKAVPLTTYMNLNSPDKSMDLDEDIDMKQKEKDIDRFMEHLGKNFHKKEEKKENEYIGKKRNKKILEDISEDEESNIGAIKSKSYMRKSIEKKELDENSEKSNFSENNKKINEDEEEKINDKKVFNGKGRKKKKLIKKKKTKNKSNEMSENFDMYFRKIKETRKKQEEDEERKDSVIKEIMEQSQLLTPEGLRVLAKLHRIEVMNDNTLSQYDLNRKEVNQLDRVLVDINFNSDVVKLNNGENNNIKKMKEREKKSMEEQRLREQKKLQRSNQNLINNHNRNNSNAGKNSENKKESDITDNVSESSDDSI